MEVQTQTAQETIFADIEHEHEMREAAAGRRLVNYIVDFVVFYGFLMGFIFVLAVICFWFGVDITPYFSEETAASKLFIYLFSGVMIIIWYSFIEGVTKGRSLGKYITGTRAVRLDGSEISWKDAFKRSACRLIPFEPFSGFGGRFWHDSIAKTTVVRNKKY